MIKAALLGFGTVGSGVYTVIQTHQQKLRDLLGEEVKIVAILIQNPEKQREIAEGVLVTTNFADILNIPDLQVAFDAIGGENPSYEYVTQLIARRCDVITANKEMFAHHGKKLLKLAIENQVKIGYEATVAGGIPLIRTISQQLQINQIEKIQAIINGTSNFILSEMRTKQTSFAEALQIAQQLGYAEADPANDIEGLDAFFKLMILSGLAFNQQPIWDDVNIKGISTLTRRDIQTAHEKNLRYKHIAQVEKVGHTIRASVSPALLDKTHPLYHVEGVDNAVLIQASLAGTISIQGPGAGSYPTASAMMEDFTHIYQSKKIVLI